MYNTHVKKYFFVGFLGLAGALTGCLKDDGFDSGEYGSVTGNTAGGKFVSIPLAAKNPNSMGLESKAGAQTINLFQLSYDYQIAAESAISATVAVNNALITDPAITILPTASYTIPSPTVAFKAGQVISDPFAISVNTSALDPSKTYGIAFSLTGASDGIALAENLKNVIFKFSVKNKYDGKYGVQGYLYHPSAPRSVTTATLGGPKTVATSGPTSVTIPLGDLGGSGYIALVTVNETTNKLTVQVAAGAAGGPYTQMDTGLPTDTPGYTAAWAGSPQCNNTYDPATKTFKLRYGYMGGTGWRVTEEILVKQ
jgi:Domain of unknown function (DUF1735)